MVHGHPTIDLRHGRNEQWPNSIAEDIDGDDEAPNCLVRAVKVSHDQLDAWRDHRRCQRGEEGNARDNTHVSPFALHGPIQRIALGLSLPNLRCLDLDLVLWWS